MSDLPPHARLLLGIRRQQGWSQYDLAVQIGVSVRTIRRWERGESEPHPRDLTLFRSLLSLDAVSTGSMAAAT